MQFSFQAGIIFATIAFVSASVATLTRENLAQDGTKFWNRLLQSDGGSIPLPAAPPALAPSANPIAPTEILPPPTHGSPGDCFVNVATTCVARDDGTPCNELLPPNPQCADGSEINSLTFENSGRSCNPTANKQGSETLCEDNSPIGFRDQVTVLCRDGEVIEYTLVVEPPVVEIGVSFSVFSPSGGALPSKINCTVIDIHDAILQQVVIDTSGDVQLNLNDEFGAFTVVACDLPSSSRGEQKCFEMISYTIGTSNTGTVDMDITVLELLDFDGPVSDAFYLYDLLGELESSTVSPGDSTRVSANVLIDLCVGAESCFEINVEAKSPNGTMCQDSLTYCIEIAPLPPTPIPPIAPSTMPNAPTYILPPDAPTNIPPQTPDAPTNIPPPVVPASYPSLPTVPTSKSKDGSSKSPNSKSLSDSGDMGPPSSPSMPSETSMLSGPYSKDLVL